MASGHLLLQGWNLTFASYWTSDAPLYALAVRLDGLRPRAALPGSCGHGRSCGHSWGVHCPGGCRGVPALAGGVAVVALLAFLHSGHGAVLRRQGVPRQYRAVRAVGLCRAETGTFRTGMGLGGGPARGRDAGRSPTRRLRGNTFAPRRFSWRGCGSEGGKAPRAMSLLRSPVWGSPPSLVGSRTRGGAFRSQPALSVVNLHQIFANLGHAPGYFSDLLGLTNGLRHNGGVPFGLRAVHVVGSVCVCWPASLSL